MEWTSFEVNRKVKSQLWLFIIVSINFLFIPSIVAQLNSFTFEGGYAFGNAQYYRTNFPGWKVNGLFEYHPKEHKLCYGFSIGYIKTSNNLIVSSGGNEFEYSIGTVPIVIVPKYIIGNGSFQGFIKTDLGYQFSNRKRLNSSESALNQSGFYGGIGAGIMKSFGPKYFIHLDYEFAYMTNSYYENGLLNSIMLGVGSRFD